MNDLLQDVVAALLMLTFAYVVGGWLVLLR
jgi:hypothetical protein